MQPEEEGIGDEAWQVPGKMRMDESIDLALAWGSQKLLLIPGQDFISKWVQRAQ